MNVILKIFLSMSFSGTLLILVLFWGKRFLKDKISRQWQYYIWLIVIFRLLLPFGLETNLMGKIYQAVDQTITKTNPLPQQESPLPAPEGALAPAAGLEQGNENANPPAEDLTTVRPLQDIVLLLINHIWLIWLAVALGMLMRKVTIYRSFILYIHAGATPASDIEILDRLSIAAEKTGVKRPVELCIHPLISSPLLIGFFHPCIVLPGIDISEKDFQYIALHELTHYKRLDMFYKWLVQITVCLHWFNPFVHLMGREITKACEFSCDEAVLAKMGYDNAPDYGKTLLDAMVAAGKYKENPVAVTLSENKQLLKERLAAIMSFKRKSKAIQLLTGVLTLCVIIGTAFVGIYPVAAAADVPNSTNIEKSLPSPFDNPSMADDPPVMETLDLKGTTYYLVRNEAQLRAIGTGGYGMDLNYMQQADIQLSTNEWSPIGTWENPFTGTFNGNGFEITGLTMTDPDAKIVGLFGVAENAHLYNIVMRDYDITSAGRNAAGKSVGAVLAVGQWVRSYDNFAYPKETGEDIEHYYKNDNLPLFEIAFSRLDESAQKIWFEKAYADENIVFFSILADYMDKKELESWLNRALKDGKWNFQSMLFDKLGRGNEFDELEEMREKEGEKAQMAEYQAAGVTMDGKNYYYQGQLVNIFLDIRANKSFYTLNMNPVGTVNIKIIRDADNKITGATYMTEAEVAKLLGDMNDPDDE